MAENRRSAPRGGHGHGPQGHGFQRPKDMKGTFRKLMHYVGRYKGALVLVAVCLIVSSAASVGSSYLLKPLLNDYIIPGDFPGLLKMLVVLGGMFALSSLCSFAYARIMVHVAQRTVAAIRQDLFDHLQALPDATKLIIAQRITSVMDADRIIVLDDGHVVGLGTHEQLMKHCDIYREVYESQQEGVSIDG